jgi:CRP-like cAMP-binding protein
MNDHVPEAEQSSGRRRHVIATIAPGTVFGEMSLLEELPRSATCSARTDAMALEFRAMRSQRS